MAELERERLEAIREAEERRAAKHARMEAEREGMRQGVRDKVRELLACRHVDAVMPLLLLLLLLVARIVSSRCLMSRWTGLSTAAIAC